MTTEAERPGHLEAIVLAAGAGARFGGAKLTAPWGGGMLIDGALTAAFAAPARSVILVTGADGQVATAAIALAERLGESARLRIVHAVAHAEGMAASLRTGIGALPGDTAGAFMFLGDMPRVPHAILPRLAQALAAGALSAAPLHNDRRGHPVLFGWQLFNQLRGLKGDEGARSVLGGLSKLALVETADPGVLFDVDRPGDI